MLQSCPRPRKHSIVVEAWTQKLGRSQVQNLPAILGETCELTCSNLSGKNYASNMCLWARQGVQLISKGMQKLTQKPPI